MKTKKSRKISAFLILILCFVLIGYVVYLSISKDKNQVKIIKTIPDYNYNLKDNETDIYNKEFDYLAKTLSEEEVDYKKYAMSISKLFIIDFYTLNNKLSKNDIGGVAYVHPDIKENFIENARSNFYKYLKVKNDETSNKLPEVNKIENIKVTEGKFKYNDKIDDAYNVIINWSYTNDLDYEDSATITIVRQDKKLYIVEMN
ncbi:MAG: hypothetical protein RSA10_04025 [Bacilli bacterium]